MPKAFIGRGGRQKILSSKKPPKTTSPGEIIKKLVGYTETRSSGGTATIQSSLLHSGHPPRPLKELEPFNPLRRIIRLLLRTVMVTPMATIRHQRKRTTYISVVVENFHSLAVSSKRRRSVQDAERLCNENRVKIKKVFHD